jgi:hypothetical protein
MITRDEKQAQSPTGIAVDQTGNQTANLAANVMLRDQELIVASLKAENDQLRAENTDLREWQNKAMHIIGRYRVRSGSPYKHLYGDVRTNYSREYLENQAKNGEKEADSGNVYIHTGKNAPYNRLYGNENEHERLKDENARLREQLERCQALINWTRTLFSNDTIPQACKLVLWQFYMVFFLMRPTISGEEMRIGVEETAAALGISTSTVRNATNRAEEYGVLKRRYEPYKTQDGEKRTFVHIMLDHVVESPADIKMEKIQGGARIKKCPKCGTEEVDRYTVQYCSCCNENRWYAQPGLRADADVAKAMNAPNYPGHEKMQKQLAFNEHEPDAAQLSSRLNTAIATVDAAQPAEVVTELPAIEKPFRRTKKQDAFAQTSTSHDQAAHILPASAPAQLATEHPITSNRVKLPMIEQKTISCKAMMPLNKFGQPAHALDPVKSYRPCGCTDQIWSHELQQRVCAECWTPVNS